MSTCVSASKLEKSGEKYSKPQIFLTIRRSFFGCNFFEKLLHAEKYKINRRGRGIDSIERLNRFNNYVEEGGTNYLLRSVQQTQCVNIV